jgi:hypothetical protein
VGDEMGIAYADDQTMDPMLHLLHRLDVFSSTCIVARYGKHQNLLQVHPRVALLHGGHWSDYWWIFPNTSNLSTGLINTSIYLRNTNAYMTYTQCIPAPLQELRTQFIMIPLSP